MTTTEPAVPVRRTCRVEDCLKPSRSNRLCVMHATRMRRTGFTDPGPRSKEGVESRFWKQIDKHPSGCWVWTGHINNQGYGRMGKQYSHRYSYELHHGPIPEGLYVMHACDNPPCANPPCANPDHLRVGTQAENMEDAASKGRLSRQRSWARGSRQGSAKLAERDIPTIRELHQQGVTQRAIAKRFGVTQSTIWGILHNRTWRHI